MSLKDVVRWDHKMVGPVGNNGGSGVL